MFLIIFILSIKESSVLPTSFLDDCKTPGYFSHPEHFRCCLMDLFPSSLTFSPPSSHYDHVIHVIFLMPSPSRVLCGPQPIGQALDHLWHTLPDDCYDILTYSPSYRLQKKLYSSSLSKHLTAVLSWKVSYLGLKLVTNNPHCELILYFSV